MAVEHAIRDEGTVAEFSADVRGDVIEPGDEQYDDARAVWNGMIDKHPALVVRCAGVADVIRTLEFAREQDLPIAIRGGGHNIAGSAVCDGGAVVDLSEMRSVSVDPDAKTARVEPGATLGDFDHEAQAFGLATPLGINSTTGVAGLTLGGGFGWLTRRYGLSIDNLRSVDIVTADGDLRHANETENADLFWAIRGGSGNFGVVTAFEFDLHEVGPEILSGPLVYAHEDARAVLENMRAFNESAPEEMTVWAVLRKAPPLPFLDESDVGTDVVVLLAFYAGELSDGEKLLAPLREFGDPLGDGIGPHQYAEFQQAFDPLMTAGDRNYWKSHNFDGMSDEAIETVAEYAGNLPSDQSEIFFGHLGGAMNQVPTDATAYPHRDATYVMNVHTRWESPARDDECIAWAREFYEEMAPHAIGGVYVNFISDREGEESLAYGENYDRLAEIKRRYDPENVFQTNQNVTPAPITAK